MGDQFAGIVHPCKIYNILSVGIPFLYIGPNESHVADIAAASDGFPVYSAAHDNVDTVVRHIRAAATGDGPQPLKGRELVRQFSRGSVLPRLIDLLEANVVNKSPAIEYQSPATDRTI
jgi:hypothetical protein